MIPVRVGQTTASKRRMIFHLVQEDGITPATGEGGGQPEISIDGGAWAAAGIGTLAHTGFGRCYADVDVDTVSVTGRVIDGRYKSANTAECPAREVLRVVAYDPDDGATLGLTVFGTIVAALAGLLDVVTDGFDAVRAKTDQLVFNLAGKVEAAIVDAVSFAQAAADNVWASATRTLTAFGFEVEVSDGSIGEIVDGINAGMTDPLATQVPGSYPSGTAGAKLGMIGDVSVSIVSPWSVIDGKLRITRGDDYTGSEAIDFVDEGDVWPEPVTEAVLTMKRGGAVALQTDLEVVTPSGSGKRVRLELTATQTATLTPGTPGYRFDVQLTAGGKTKTPIIGKVDVIEDETP